MSKDLLFSVIIPVYNMELYLERCLDSIVNQSYTNLEIIIVNDGSVDNSLRIIKKYADTDNRIVVIDKINEGIGGAYIDALSVAKGDYISFVDGDDYVDLDMYEVLAQHISEKKADVIQFGYQSFDSNDVVTFEHVFEEKYIVGNKNVENYYYNKIPHPSIGLKVMKKELFQDIVLLRQNVGIDVLVSLQIFMRAESLLLIKNKFYHIFIREQSVSRAKYDEKKVKQLENIRKELFQISSTRPEIFKYIMPTLINETIIITSYYYKMRDYTKVKYLIKEYRTYFKLMYKSLLLSRWQVQLKAVSFLLFPRIYCKFKK
ncbi:glycosyltransferase family 2 protein [uncultured Chryseobacterium sp.]|jgi:Glycosyltransferases involved in cell wall biogenesis|uniref:glycosyltransferase family 2 protein n=1 Tax=uncultured Chryseobacterium sp. TaxID=259322 RepID=UPI00262E4657|nr:glycosyltransferase family 2 protein [uncultured Chryseobacterium sp.]